MKDGMIPSTRRSPWSRRLTQWCSAGAFLGPSLIGLLVFTVLPLLVSLVMAFTNWDLRLHNSFRNAPLRFIGFDNFLRLLGEPELWRYFGNTLFLMIGIPFGVVASLALALAISGNMRGSKPGTWRLLIGVCAVFSACLTAVAFAQGISMSVLLCGCFCIIIAGGVLGGSVFYRTLCYLPSFTSGVAVYLLWKKLYNPSSGPINVALQAPLRRLQQLVEAVPWSVRVIAVLLLGVSLLGLFWAVRVLRLAWQDADWGMRACSLALLILLLPNLLAWQWLDPIIGWGLLLSAPLIVGWQISRTKPRLRGYLSTGGDGSAISFGLLMMAVQIACIALAAALWRLPQQVASNGLQPPTWLASVTWAKPAIMIAAFWAAIGSNNMLLYLAGLSGISPELYEAADIDGASRWQRFWNITWPQLAPTTFFIGIMSIIAGLQGGFEMAQAMTQGGPAGSTTTLSYFIYMEGFQTGRLGYSSAVAWFLFALVLLVTLTGWKFGSQHAEA